MVPLSQGDMPVDETLPPIWKPDNSGCKATVLMLDNRGWYLLKTLESLKCGTLSLSQGELFRILVADIDLTAYLGQDVVIPLGRVDTPLTFLLRELLDEHIPAGDLRHILKSVRQSIDEGDRLEDGPITDLARSLETILITSK